MRKNIIVTSLAVLALAGFAQAAEKAAAKTAVNPVAGMLTKAQIEQGWIALFDGHTTFGWKVDGDSKVADGEFVLGGDKATTATTTAEFGNYELAAALTGDVDVAEIVLNGKTTAIKAHVKNGKFEAKVTDTGAAEPVAIKVPAGKTLKIKKIVLKPTGEKSLFNGKDLTGWKEVPGHASKFTVTDKGEINVKDGNGSLQSEWQGDDFVLQIDVISNGRNLNSGVFFRALPGDFWQGYEAQIRNEWSGYSKDDKRNAEPEDRTKPVDIGTGGIYNRQPTRKVVSSDHEWFTMTVIANGKHISTWVDGYQCTDYVDDEADAPSARKGRFLGKGCLGLQGHDPTTDLSFKNIRVTELKRKAEAK